MLLGLVCPVQYRNICVFPFSDHNDYQRLSIKDFPSSYKIHKIRNAGLLPLAAVPSDSILIIDWLSPYCLSNNSFISFVRSSLFLLQVLFLKIFRRTLVIQNIHNHNDHEHRSPYVEHGLQFILVLLSNRLRFFSKVSLQSYTEIFGGRSKAKIIYHPSYQLGGMPSEIKKFDLIFFGNIRSYKGILRYLNSSFLDRLSHADKKFLMAGSVHQSVDIGQYQLDHKSLAVDLTYVSEKKLRNYINESKFAFLPYDDITTSGALYYAIACQIPVIVKRLPFFTEILGSDYPYFFDREEEVIKILNGVYPEAWDYSEALKKKYVAEHILEGLF